MSAFQKIDSALGDYYKALGEYDYFDNDGIGKFLRFCNEQEFDEKEIDEELSDIQNCGYIDFDSDFPFTAPIWQQNDSVKQKEIFKIIKHCHKFGYHPPLNMRDFGYDENGKKGLKPRKPFKFASPERARRFVLDISNSPAAYSEPDHPGSPTALLQRRRIEQSLKNKKALEANQRTLQRNMEKHHRMRNMKKEQDSDDEEDDISDLQKLCGGLAEYYCSMKRNDYYNDKGIGKFTQWFDEEEMDINEMKEELIDGTIDDCSYLDFDKDDETKINGFPLPSHIIDENEKLQKQFEIMAHIFRTGKLPKIDKNYVLSINFDIEKEDEDRSRKVYELQCPRLIRCFFNEKDLMKLLSISYCNNNTPFALWMVDCFMRDRLDEFIKNKGKQITVNEWTQNGIHHYVENKLKNKYTMNGKHDIITCLQHGIKAYIHRILPQFKFDIFCSIKDDLFQIAHYIEAASQFIIKIVNEDNKTHVPFQVMWCYNFLLFFFEIVKNG